MSKWVETVRAARGGTIDRGTSVEYVVGHPHPLWDQMCDVIDAANKLEWRLKRRLPLYSARWRLNEALDALSASVQPSAEDGGEPREERGG